MGCFEIESWLLDVIYLHHILAVILGFQGTLFHIQNCVFFRNVLDTQISFDFNIGHKHKDDLPVKIFVNLYVPECKFREGWRCFILLCFWLFAPQLVIFSNLYIVM